MHIKSMFLKCGFLGALLFIKKRSTKTGKTTEHTENWTQKTDGLMDKQPGIEATCKGLETCAITGSAKGSQLIAPQTSLSIWWGRRELQCVLLRDHGWRRKSRGVTLNAQLFVYLAKGLQSVPAIGGWMHACSLSYSPFLLWPVVWSLCACCILTDPPASARQRQRLNHIDKVTSKRTRLEKEIIYCHNDYMGLCFLFCSQLLLIFCLNDQGF